MDVNRIVQHLDINGVKYANEHLTVEGEVRVGGFGADGRVHIPLSDAEAGELAAKVGDWYARASEDGVISTAELANLGLTAGPEVLEQLLERGLIPEQLARYIKMAQQLFALGK